MVSEALDHPRCSRIAVTAFANKQVFPLAGKLGSELGADRVCLFVADDRLSDVPPSVLRVVTRGHDDERYPERRRSCAWNIAQVGNLGRG